MKTVVNSQGNQGNILAILNSNIVLEENQKEAILAMGVSSCQVACMSYKCCTGHGRGGKHIEHSYKFDQ